MREAIMFGEREARATAGRPAANGGHGLKNKATARALAARQDSVAAVDRLGQAGSWLRKAVAVPYDAHEPSAWAREFQVCVAAARRVLAGRSAGLRGGRGLPPRLLASAAREAEAHEQAMRLADDLFTDAYLATEPDLLEMVDLVEGVKALERAIERLRERRSDLLFESTYRDLGGGG